MLPHFETIPVPKGHPLKPEKISFMATWFFVTKCDRAWLGAWSISWLKAYPALAIKSPTTGIDIRKLKNLDVVEALVRESLPVIERLIRAANRSWGLGQSSREQRIANHRGWPLNNQISMIRWWFDTHLIGRRTWILRPSRYNRSVRSRETMSGSRLINKANGRHIISPLSNIISWI
jgi:hypothetical protein